MEQERIITNDLYMAAFLMCHEDCNLDRIEQNRRRRISFILTGNRVRKLREDYRTGPVLVSLRTYRENLKTVRRKMDLTQRSVLCNNPIPSLQPQT